MYCTVHAEPRSCPQLTKCRRWRASCNDIMHSSFVATAIIDLPAHLTPGAYDLIVIANGIASPAVSVTIESSTTSLD
jgi:hypothetical protein